MSQRLPVLSYREIMSALAKAGFQEIPGRGKGIHVFIYRDDPPKGITVPREKDVKTWNASIHSTSGSYGG